MFFDVETTGLLDFSLPADDPKQPRLAQLAMVLCDDEGAIAAQHNFYVQPDGWEMPEEASKLNHLTTEQLRADGVPVAQVLDAWEQAIAEAPQIVIAHGVTYDLKIMRGELRRAGRLDRFDDTKDRTYCTMRKATGWCKIPQKGRGGYKFPKLQEAYTHFFKEPFEGAHGALQDALAVRRIYLRMRELGAK